MEGDLPNLNLRITQRCDALSIPVTVDTIYCSLARQRLFHFCAGSVFRVYRCSTGRAAPSCVEGSLGTPSGLHRVAEKIGAGEAIGTVFRGRQPVGNYLETPAAFGTENLITTRILWLDGLEQGHNRGTAFIDGRVLLVDTHSRYIYIHGTNRVERLGQPESHGCICLGDRDVVELFEAIETGTLVLIAD